MGAQHMPTKRSLMDTLGSDAEKLQLAITRRKIEILSQESAIRQHWPDAPPGCEIVVPGPSGHSSYIVKIKERLKAEGFRFNGEHKLWYRLPHGAGALPKGIAAFNLGGVVATEVSPK